MENQVRVKTMSKIANSYILNSKIRQSLIWNMDMSVPKQRDIMLQDALKYLHRSVCLVQLNRDRLLSNSNLM